ncbi:MAG TPA: PrsW family intramembrane metalloprotease [Microlunatus sp.]|nr:PrsW family intramembrane metalloprotease [Microlunatus sp.]
MQPPAAPPPTAYRPQFGRTVATVGVPTSVLILAGIATALALSFDVVANPVLATVGIVLSGAACALVVLSYLWLDRWEPEPSRLLLFAWLWGGVAVVLSLITSLVDSDYFTSSVIRAPIVEEFTKGLFLLIMATGIRRRELNTLIDCLVYAGLVGASFGFIENVLYLARGEDIYGTISVAIIRLTTPFLHSLFTSVTAIGLYVGLRRSGKYAWLGFLGLGYVGAVLLHMLWNATSIWVHFALFLPLFGAAVALAIVARHREQKVLLGQLPGMVGIGLITAEEAAWLATLRGRKIWADETENRWGKDARRVVQTFASAITELAFVRERFSKGSGSPEAAQRHAELVAAVLGLYRPPVPAAIPPAPPEHELRPGALAPAVGTAAGGSAGTGYPAHDGPATWNPIPGPP